MPERRRPAPARSALRAAPYSARVDVGDAACLLGVSAVMTNVGIGTVGSHVGPSRCSMAG